MDPDLLVLTALQVLVSVVNGERPEERLVNELRQYPLLVLSEEEELPIDVLCRTVINQRLADPTPLRARAERASKTSYATLAEIERTHIEWVFGNTGKNVSKTAKILNIDRSTLYTKLRRYGLK